MMNAEKKEGDVHFCFDLMMFKVHSKCGNMLSPHDNQFTTRQNVYKTHIQKKRQKHAKQMGQIWRSLLGWEIK